MYLFNTITGDYMDKKRYKEIVDKHTPKENVIKNGMYISKCTCHLLLELFVNFLPAGYHL